MRADTQTRWGASVGIALSVASLPWALGVFLAAAGAMMLVAPHQFGEPGYDALRRQLPWWGVSFCCAGAGLLAARVFALPRWLLLAFHPTPPRRKATQRTGQGRRVDAFPARPQPSARDAGAPPARRRSSRGASAAPWPPRACPPAGSASTPDQ